MTQEFAAEVADGVILSPALSTPLGTERMIANVKRGEESRGAEVERASYMLTSVDPDSQQAIEEVRNYYFFIYQLSEVVKPEVLAPYGVTEEALRPMKEAYRKGRLQEAKELVPAVAIEALSVSGTREHALDRIEEYRKAGVTLPILMPIGNVEYAVDALAQAPGVLGEQGGVASGNGGPHYENQAIGVAGQYASV
jgi:alkanesulfonate monooxygenase SsuD/methylene tetrahydromethanopterin reductase-like flavin-dependent oxidoreductase (luciferase family)